MARTIAPAIPIQAPSDRDTVAPMPAHRRLAAWQAAGVWERLHRELLGRLNADGLIDWSTAVVDGSHIRALLGGP